MFNKAKNEAGQAFVIAIIVLGVIIVITLVIISGSFNFRENTRYNSSATQALSLAEAGVDKAVASLNATAGTYSGENETTLGPGSYSISVTSKDLNTKIITATGYVPSKTSAKATRTVKIQVSKGTGVSFVYAVQVGDGGLMMDNNAQVNGSVYSNGNITLTNNAKITGDAYVAGGIQPAADQTSDCAGINCADFVFGKSVNGQSQLDVAQSFKPTSTNVLNKVSLKLKKFGSPPDLTVRILGDNSGNPNKFSVLASGTLTANLVATQYSFVDVIFPSPPTLSANTSYWILVDSSSDNNNYWAWSDDTAQGYNGGTGKWSPNWQAASPNWNNINGDLGFKTYMGGVATSIIGANGALIGGDAHANTLQYLTVTGGAYYQLQQGVTAGSLHPNSTDPVAKPMPISDGNIQDWKDQAAAFGVHNGDISNCPSSIPAGKYGGSINLPGLCNTKVGSPIWVTGNFSLTNSDTVSLDPSYGNSSGIIVVDGFGSMANNNKLIGTGQPGSFLILLSTFDSKDDSLSRDAITLTNNGNTGIVYSNLGSISLSNNNNLTSLTAWKLHLSNNVIVNYDQGLSSSFFTSGPSGSFSAVKGTYQAQ